MSTEHFQTYSDGLGREKASKEAAGQEAKEAIPPAGLVEAAAEVTA